MDTATQVAELSLRFGLSQRKPEGPRVATGRCLCCGETIEEPGRRWCDADCRDLWEAKQAR